MTVLHNISWFWKYSRLKIFIASPLKHLGKTLTIISKNKQTAQSINGQKTSFLLTFRWQPGTSKMLKIASY